MPFQIVHNDITRMAVDAIVNTANEAPVYAEGVDAAVYRAAGETELLKARKKIGWLKEGEAAITSGFALQAKYIIHAVSPFYKDGSFGEEERLRSCYRNSLVLAREYQCRSIAFPLIATGNFGYPREEAMEIALQEIQKFLMNTEMMVYLVVFDDESVRLSGKIFDEIESYVDAYYVEEKLDEEYDFICSRQPSVIREARSAYGKKNEKLLVPQFLRPTAKSDAPCSLEDIIKNAGETFQQRLFRMIDERGLSDVEVYKKAGKDKKLFHKIKVNPDYQPSKQTVFAFALALQLSLEETKELLASAGYAFSPSSKFDLILRYVFEQEIYDIYKVDCILYDFNLDKYYFNCI